MLTKTCLAAFAAAALASNGALALGHRHDHGREQKRALVYEATETVTDIEWVTITVDPNKPSSSAPVVEATPSTTSSKAAETTPSRPSVPSPAPPSSSTSASSSSTIVIPTPNPNTPVVAPVTPATSFTPPSPAAPSQVPKAPEVAAAAAAPSISPSPVAVAPPVAATPGKKRGAAYNVAKLVSPLIGSGSRINWAYNWGQVSDGLDKVDSSLEYVPMLWSNRQDFISTWDANAKSAISNGAKNFLGFNEPDNAGQANMDAASAAAAYIKYLTPYASSVRLGSPAITNSGTDGQGVSWLKEWVGACNGQCNYSFCAAHWYSPPSSADFLNYVTKVHEACGTDKAVWVTEFAPIGADDATISSFLGEVQDALDNNSTYSFVERYSYFYVAEGHLVTGNSPSTYGRTFAYGGS